MKKLLTVAVTAAFALAVVGCAKKDDSYNPNNGQVVVNHSGSMSKLGKLGNGAGNSDYK